MLKLVIIFNTLIALGGFYLAWNLWKVGNLLQELNDNLQELESLTEQIKELPTEIKSHRQNLRQFRQDYVLLQRQLGRLKQFLALVSLSRMFWNHYQKHRFFRQKIYP